MVSLRSSGQGKERRHYLYGMKGITLLSRVNTCVWHDMFMGRTHLCEMKPLAADGRIEKSRVTRALRKRK